MKTKTKKKNLLIGIICFAIIAMAGNSVIYAQSCKTTKSDCESKSTSSQLYEASEQGDLDLLKELMDSKDFDVNQELKHKQRAVILASYSGHLEFVNYLIDKGAELNHQNEWGNTAMHDAAMQGHLEIAQKLYKSGAKLSAKGQNGFTPLHFACLKEKPEMVAFFIKNKVDVNTLDDYERPPVIVASWRHNKEILLQLIEAGADLNLVSNEKNGALHNVSGRGYAELAALLIENNASANVKDGDGRLPLHLASKFYHHETVSILAKVTNNINEIDEVCGRTGLHYSCINGDQKSAKVLIDAGIDAAIKDKNGKTAVDYAIKYGFVNLVSKMAENNMALKTDIEEAQKMNKISERKINSGEVQVVYAGHSGWIIQTEDKVLVFDYWNLDRPKQSSLANGTLNPNEMKNKKVYVFTSHDHGDHYDPFILEWAKDIKDITYVFGFKAEDARAHKEEGYSGPEYVNIAENKMYKLNDMKITTIKSNDSGQGFLVETNGISMFHPGDHAWFAPEDEEVFKKEIDFISMKNNHVDLVFLPVSGCPGRWKKEHIMNGFFYTIDQLNPEKVFPMHAVGREHLLEEFAEEGKKRNYKTDIICIENMGDNILYNQNKIAKKE